MISKMADVLLYNLGFTTRSCGRCGIDYEVKEQWRLHRDNCPVCTHEIAEETEIWATHNINPETAKEHRKEGEYVDAVTGEWYGVDELVVMNIPLFEDNHSDIFTRSVVPARVLDRKRTRKWAQKATEKTKELDVRNAHIKDELKGLRADRPGFPERHLRNHEIEENVYYGVPKYHRPDPTEDVIIYQRRNQERIEPAPELLDRRFTPSHDWGKSTSDNSAAITAASLLSHAYDESVANEYAYPLGRSFIGTDRFARNKGIWSMPQEEMDQALNQIR